MKYFSKRSPHLNPDEPKSKSLKPPVAYLARLTTKDKFANIFEAIRDVIFVNGTLVYFPSITHSKRRMRVRRRYHGYNSTFYACFKFHARTDSSYTRGNN